MSRRSGSLGFNRVGSRSEWKIMIAVKKLAHDARLPRPDWLVNQFKAKEVSVMVEGKPMTVFQHQAESEEIVTLGPNVLVPDGRSCYMYLVFVTAAGK